MMGTDVLRSGSGKTTLLNILAHRAAVPKATVRQDLYINGTPTDLTTFRKLSCYVEQEDALVGSLTVRETLYFAAQLALPRSASPLSLPISNLAHASQLRHKIRTQVPHRRPAIFLRSAKPSRYAYWDADPERCVGRSEEEGECGESTYYESEDLIPG